MSRRRMTAMEIRARKRKLLEGRDRINAKLTADKMRVLKEHAERTANLRVLTPEEKRLRQEVYSLKGKLERTELIIDRRKAFAEEREERMAKMRERQNKWELALLTAHVYNGILSSQVTVPGCRDASDTVLHAIKIARIIKAGVE